ncbi:UNVERIFIED_CONTAM: RNA-binding protein Luc7-like 1 [Trichonephila clavipes]
MDLGECPKLHDLALRADYENAKKTKDYYYDVDVSTNSLCVNALVYADFQSQFISAFLGVEDIEYFFGFLSHKSRLNFFSVEILVNAKYKKGNYLPIFCNCHLQSKDPIILAFFEKKRKHP